MNETVLADIDSGKKLYPLVLREIINFHHKKFYPKFFLNNITIFPLVNRLEEKNLLKTLHSITGKDIDVIDSYINGWESEWIENVYEN